MKKILPIITICIIILIPLIFLTQAFDINNKFIIGNNIEKCNFYDNISNKQKIKIPSIINISYNEKFGIKKSKIMISVTFHYPIILIGEILRDRIGLQLQRIKVLVGVVGHLLLLVFEKAL